LKKSFDKRKQQFKKNTPGFGIPHFHKAKTKWGRTQEKREKKVSVSEVPQQVLSKFTEKEKKKQRTRKYPGQGGNDSQGGGKWGGEGILW